MTRRDRMNARIFAAISIPAAFAIASCATLSGERIVYVEVGGDNACIVTIGRAAHPLPAQRETLGRRLRSAARGGASALMSPQPALTSPGCWDDVVAMVQAAGFRRIGFFSEEPESGAERVG